jgi:O-antigen/teichoic acid export membrane protein
LIIAVSCSRITTIRGYRHRCLAAGEKAGKVNSTEMNPVAERLKLLLERSWKLRHEMTWIVTGQVIGFLGGFIGIKVLTNIMGPKGYGQLALGLTIAGIFNMYVYGPIANVVARFFVAYRERGQLGSYFAVLKKYHGLLAVMVSLSSLAASGIAGLYLGGEWALIILLSSLYGVASGINVSYISLQSAIRQRKIVALHQGADVWLRIGLSVALLLLLGNSGYFSLLGYLLGTLLVTISQGIFALRNNEIRFYWRGDAADDAEKRETYREFSGYAASFVIFAVFASVSMYSDRWILQGMFGVSVVGIYSAIYQIAASPVNIFFAMVNQLVVPIVFERAGTMTSAAQAENSAKLVRLTVVLSSLAGIFVTAVSCVFSEPLVRLLTNGTFAGFHNILWIIVLGLFLFNIAQLFTIKGLYCNRPRIYFWPKAWQACSFLLLAYPLAKKYGIYGVAAAICGSSLLYLGSVVFVNRKIALNFNA